MFYIFLFLPLSISPSAITYELNGGRFGDNMSTYCKAQFFSYKTGIPLLYKPFEHSNVLAMHTQEQPLGDKQVNNFSQVVRVATINDITKNDDGNTLFISHFYSQTPDLYHYCLQDPTFDALIKKMLTPVIALPLLEKKEGELHVGLHVRKGSGGDKPLASLQIYKTSAPRASGSHELNKNKPQYADQIWPTKFPPDQYYLDQLHVLRRLVGPEQLLIIHLFTDDPNPAAVAQRYREYLHDPHMAFMYHTNANAHDDTIIEDFYAMAQCDCLIRSSSLYAKAAQLLGTHTIILFPQHGYWDVDKVIIDPLGISIRS